MMQSLCEKHFGDGDTSARNVMRLLCAYFAIQKLHGMDEFREMHKKTNNAPHIDKFQECALT